MSTQPIAGYTEFRSGPKAHAYNETAFRYFLTVDRRRAERSRRSVLLLLVTTREPSGQKLSMTMAPAVFAALGDSVRDGDFVGWYREGHVIAAVLAQGARTTNEVRERAIERVVQAMHKRLTPGQVNSLRVRAVCLSGRVRT